MPPENKETVDDVLDEAAKAAKERVDAEKSKADKEAQDAASKREPVKDAPPQKSLDELIKDPKIREQIKAVRGWSDAQLDSSFQMAPMQEEMARLKTEKKYPDFGDHADFIDKEIQGIAIFDRTPQVMERLYWMAKGKKDIENPRKEAPERKPDVVGERIHTPYPSSASGSGAGRGGKASTLTEEEKYVADQLGVPHDKYEASKKGHRPDRPESKKYIRPPEPYKVPQGGNSADQALGVMMRPGRR